MRKFTSEDGREVILGVHHTSGTRKVLLDVEKELFEPAGEGLPPVIYTTTTREWIETPVRVTQAKITIKNGAEEVTAMEEAICHPNDNFNRFRGRLISARKLLNNDEVRKNLSRKDLGSIMSAICPEISRV